MIIPSFILFILGFGFVDIMIVPLTIRILYGFANSITAQPFITLENMVAFVIGTGFLGGLAFQIPILMYISTKMKIVKSGFWLRYWHWAAAGFLIITAIITPDGTGVTMLLLAIPLILLYFISALTCRKSYD